MESSWQYISQLIAKDVAFNCIYKENVCYVVVRKYQGTVTLPDWLTGAGWLDVAGVVTVSDENTFDSIKSEAITEALMLLSMNSLK